MRHLIGNFKPHKAAILIIFILLFGQAFCEMTLPQLTQNIIDVGIQNKGVEHIMPGAIMEDEFESAEIFMSADEKELWENAYDRDGKMYRLTVSDEAELDKLDSDLLKPIILTFQMGHMPLDTFKAMIGESAKDMPAAAAFDDMSADDIAAMFGVMLKSFEAKDEDGKLQTYVDIRPLMQKMIASGMMTEESLSASQDQIDKMLESMGDSTLKSMGVSYAYDCEKAAGVDVDANQRSYLWRSCFMMLAVSAAMMIVGACVSFFSSRVGASIGRSLRSQVFRRVMSYSSTEMDKFQTSSLITRATNDIQQVQMVSTMLLRMVLFAPIMGAWGIVKVYRTHAGMEWVIVLGVSVIVVLVMLLMTIALPKFRKMQKLIDNLNGVSREILTGLPVIRAFGRERTEEERFDEANTELKRTMLFTNRVMTFMSPIMMMIMFGLTVLITWVAARRIDAGDLQVGAMTAFITYAMMIVTSFMILTVMSIMLPRAGVAADRIYEVTSTESSILNKEGAEQIADATGTVVFEDVSFRYPGADTDVIHGISFTAKPGETTAVIGSTGSGKSTIVNLIPRFYDVTEGSIKVDGVDVRDAELKSLRSEIGYVPQKGVLFSGSIADNIRFGAADISDSEVREAAEVSQALDFIEEKEDGFDSFVAQGGSNVSGGQKQRLSIARAIAKHPKILIFDDSFSALDMKTDAKLRRVLSEAAADSTKIIVAQRVGTIMHAEQIIVLEDGEMAGIGTHEELMKSCDVYRQIAESQLSEKELEAM